MYKYEIMNIKIRKTSLNIDGMNKWKKIMVWITAQECGETHGAVGSQPTLYMKVGGQGKGKRGLDYVVMKHEVGMYSAGLSQPYITVGEGVKSLQAQKLNF